MMKKTLLSVLFLFATLFIYAQTETGNAKARKVNGLDIYIYAEPTQEYEEVFDAYGGWNISELAGQRVTIETIVETMVRNVKKKNEKAKKKGERTADAIIIYNNDKGSAIAYKKSE